MRAAVLAAAGMQATMVLVAGLTLRPGCPGQVVVTRMDMTAPATPAYCRADMAAGIEALVDELAARRRESLN